MKERRLLPILMTLAALTMLMFVMAVPVHAATNVDSWSGLVAALQNDGEVTLTGSFDNGSSTAVAQVSDGKTVTLNLNGKSITSSRAYVIRVGKGAKLTINGTGTIQGSTASGSLTQAGIAVDNGELIINGNVTVKRENASSAAAHHGAIRVLNGGTATISSGSSASIIGTPYGIKVEDSSSSATGTVNRVNVNGGTISGNDDGIYTKGPNVITIDGGMISSTGNTSHGIKAEGNGSAITVEDGAVSGKTHGIYALGSNTVDVNGGTISGNASSGSGIKVEGDGGTVEISGGTILNSFNGIYTEGASTVIMSDGAVSNNKNGVNIHAAAGEDPNFLMTGGSVQDNRASTTSGSAIRVENGSAVEIAGGTVSGSPVGVNMTKGSLALSGEGTISSCTTGVNVPNDDCSVTMDGGSIYNCTNGFKVTAGTVGITGGTISYDAVGSGERGLDVSGGTVSIGGGTISKAFYGAVVTGNGVTMTDGSIEHCSNGVRVENSGVFRMTGGTLKDNKAGATSGSAITMSSGAADIAGGSISGSPYGINVSGGTAYVSGDTSISSSVIGVQINGGYFKLSGEPSIKGSTDDVNLVGGGDTIDITGTLDNSDPIAVTMTTPGVFTSSDNTGYNVAEKFISGDQDYLVGKNSDGQLFLGEPCTLTYDANGAVSGTAPVAEEHAKGSVVKASGNTGELAKSDSVFGGWNTQADGEGTTYAENDTFVISEDTTLYTKWVASAVDFNRHKLNLSSEIGLRFEIEIPDGFDTQGSYVSFSVSDGKTSEMNFADAIHESGNSYWFTCYVNALELADTITATYHYGNGQTIANQYSVTEYITAVKQAYPEDVKLNALVDALQNYGYYMQQSGWRDGKSSHQPIACVKTLDGGDISTARTGVADKGMTKTVDKVDAKFALTLNDQTVINIFLKLEDGDSVKTVSAGFTPKGTRVIGEDTYLQYDSEKIGPRNLGEATSISITTNNGGSAAVTLSAMSYVKEVLKEGTAFSEAKQFAMAAYYNYYAAAVDYPVNA